MLFTESYRIALEETEKIYKPPNRVPYKCPEGAPILCTIQHFQCALVHRADTMEQISPLLY